MENSLGGFEFLSCIPGTIGGGIKMNAGCFQREFKDILISIQAVNKSGQVITILAKDINFKYRDSELPEDLIFDPTEPTPSPLLGPGALGPHGAPGGQFVSAVLEPRSCPNGSGTAF